MSPVPFATVRVESVTLPLYAGNIVGRGSVHLVVPHPDVSEAHALCTLRGARLVLLRLRGALVVDGEDQDCVAPVPGRGGGPHDRAPCRAHLFSRPPARRRPMDMNPA